MFSADLSTVTLRDFLFHFETRGIVNLELTMFFYMYGKH
jgi:hypothetical protein